MHKSQIFLFNVTRTLVLLEPHIAHIIGRLQSQAKNSGYHLKIAQRTGVFAIFYKMTRFDLNTYLSLWMTYGFDSQVIYYNLKPYLRGKLRSFLNTVISFGRLPDSCETVKKLFWCFLKLELRPSR